MTSYKQIFDTHLPILNNGEWQPATLSMAYETMHQEALDEVGWDVVEYTLDLPDLLSGLGEDSLLAVDPGYAHTGLAYITDRHVKLWQADIRAGGEFTRPSSSEIVRRLLVLDETLGFQTDFTVLEDAAFSKGNGQAHLGLVRGVWAGICTERLGTAQFLGINQIKKAIGATKIDFHKASKHYPDAVAAFAIALAGVKMLAEEGE